jgi:hypothetical protein
VVNDFQPRYAEPQFFKSTLYQQLKVTARVRSVSHRHHELRRQVFGVSQLSPLLVALPRSTAIRLSVIWGFLFLSVLSYLIARARAVSAFSEIWKHSVVAVVVILISKVIGTWFLRVTSSA